MFGPEIGSCSFLFHILLGFSFWSRQADAIPCNTDAFVVRGGTAGGNYRLISLFEEHVRARHGSGIAGYCDSCSNSNNYCVTLRLTGRISISGLPPGQGFTSHPYPPPFFPEYLSGPCQSRNCKRHRRSGGYGGACAWGQCGGPSFGGPPFGGFDSAEVTELTYRSCDFGLIVQTRGQWHGWICEAVTKTQYLHKHVAVCTREGDWWTWGSQGTGHGYGQGYGDYGRKKRVKRQFRPLGLPVDFSTPTKAPNQPEIHPHTRPYTANPSFKPHLRPTYSPTPQYKPTHAPAAVAYPPLYPATNYEPYPPPSPYWPPGGGGPPVSNCYRWDNKFNVRFATPHIVSQGQDYGYGYGGYPQSSLLHPGIQMVLHYGSIQIDCCNQPRCNAGIVPYGVSPMAPPNFYPGGYQPSFPPVTSYGPVDPTGLTQVYAPNFAKKSFPTTYDAIGQQYGGYPSPDPPTGYNPSVYPPKSYLPSYQPAQPPAYSPAYQAPRPSSSGGYPPFDPPKTYLPTYQTPRPNPYGGYFPGSQISPAYPPPKSYPSNHQPRGPPYGGYIPPAPQYPAPYPPRSHQPSYQPARPRPPPYGGYVQQPPAYSPSYPPRRYSPGYQPSSPDYSHRSHLSEHLSLPYNPSLTPVSSPRYQPRGYEPRVPPISGGYGPRTPIPPPNSPRNEPSYSPISGGYGPPRTPIIPPPYSPRYPPFPPQPPPVFPAKYPTNYQPFPPTYIPPGRPPLDGYPFGPAFPSFGQCVYGAPFPFGDEGAWYGMSYSLPNPNATNPQSDQYAEKESDLSEDEDNLHPLDPRSRTFQNFANHQTSGSGSESEPSHQVPDRMHEPTFEQPRKNRTDPSHTGLQDTKRGSFERPLEKTNLNQTDPGQDGMKDANEVLFEKPLSKSVYYKVDATISKNVEKKVPNPDDKKAK